MLLIIPSLILIFFLLIELNHKLKIVSPLILKPKSFKKKNLESKQQFITLLELSNLDKKMEVMIPFFKVNPKLIGISKDEIKSIKTKIQAIHPDEEEVTNDYWSAYILKSQKSTLVRVEVEFEIKGIAIEKLKCIWLDIEWGNYGPFGFFTRFDGLVLPDSLNTIKDKESKNNLVEPIRTHILGVFDEPISILKTYLPKDYSPSDILTIGESPLAIMQGNYLDYRTLKISFIARFLCKGFHPTSSLATACGMQTLINVSGPTRVIISWIIGGILKFIGYKGMFYRLAGHQARLIDDITGTTPPYDKSIVLGPLDTKSFCMKAAKELNINVAVVDVNDLGRVKILSTNNNNNNNKIKLALNSNPAGNANQQTPLVLIRSNQISTKSQES